MNGHEGKWFPLKGVKSAQLLLFAEFRDSLGRGAGDALADLQASDNLNDHDYGGKKTANALGAEGDIRLRPRTKKQRGSINPKNISGKMTSTKICLKARPLLKQKT